MDRLIAEFRKALEEYEAKTGKKDNLIGFGQILADELEKKNAAVVTLGQLLADFYAKERIQATRDSFHLSDIFRSTP